MPVSFRTPTLLAVAFAGAIAVTPVHAQWLYGRLVPDAPETQGNSWSQAVDVSADGKTWVFASNATNWLPGQGIVPPAVAMDADTGAIEIVSRTVDGTPIRGIYPSVSRDGRYVSFTSNHMHYGFTNSDGSPAPAPNWQVLRWDRELSQLRLVSATATGVAAEAHVDDGHSSISGDGRYVAFPASSQNLGGPIPTGYYQLWVKDMDTGAVEMASVDQAGAPSPTGCEFSPHALSDDGRYLAFACNDALLPGAGYKQVYIRDLVNNTTEIASRAQGANGAQSTTASSYVAISPSARFVTFQASWNPTLGGTAATHSGIYLRDRAQLVTVSIPRPDVPEFSNCDRTAVSDVASVLMTCRNNGVAQVYLFVPGAGLPERVSGNETTGAPGNGTSGDSVAVDASGRSMAFESAASNLVDDDTNTHSDIFVLIDSGLIFGIFSDSFEN